MRPNSMVPIAAMLAGTSTGTFITVAVPSNNSFAQVHHHQHAVNPSTHLNTLVERPTTVATVSTATGDADEARLPLLTPAAAITDPAAFEKGWPIESAAYKYIKHADAQAHAQAHAHYVHDHEDEHDHPRRQMMPCPLTPVWRGGGHGPACTPSIQESKDSGKPKHNKTQIKIVTGPPGVQIPKEIETIPRQWDTVHHGHDHHPSKNDHQHPHQLDKKDVKEAATGEDGKDTKDIKDMEKEKAKEKKKKEKEDRKIKEKAAINQCYDDLEKYHAGHRHNEWFAPVGPCERYRRKMVLRKKKQEERKKAAAAAAASAAAASSSATTPVQTATTPTYAKSAI